MREGKTTDIPIVHDMMWEYNQLTKEQKHRLAEWESGGWGTCSWPGWKAGVTNIELEEQITRRKIREARRERGTQQAGYQKKPIAEALRWQVWERDDFRCLHCGTRRFLTVDHIVPERSGGTQDLDNLQTLCKSCNSRKGMRS